MPTRYVWPHTIWITCHRQEWGRHVFNRIHISHHLVECSILSHILEPNALKAIKMHLHDILHDHPLDLIAIWMKILLEMLSLLHWVYHSPDSISLLEECLHDPHSDITIGTTDEDFGTRTMFSSRHYCWLDLNKKGNGGWSAKSLYKVICFIRISAPDTMSDLRIKEQINRSCQHPFKRWKRRTLQSHQIIKFLKTSADCRIIDTTALPRSSITSRTTTSPADCSSCLWGFGLLMENEHWTEAQVRS